MPTAAADAAPADDSSAPEDAEASLQAARAGKEAYKGLQSSTAAAVARQKAARTQVSVQGHLTVRTSTLRAACEHLYTAPSIVRLPT